MKKKLFILTALFGIMLLAESCKEKYSPYEIMVEIVNQSSKRVSGTLNLGACPFALAPGETFSTSINGMSREERPNAPSVSVIGPKELIVDGERFVLKSSVSANDFFDLYGWDVTSRVNGFLFKMNLTDKILGDMLSNADHL